MQLVREVKEAAGGVGQTAALWRSLSPEERVAASSEAESSLDALMSMNAPLEPPLGWSVAIIGAGLAGLSAAMIFWCRFRYSREEPSVWVYVWLSRQSVLAR